jgi:hypothetical protein
LVLTWPVSWLYIHFYKNKEREDRFKIKLAGTKWGANEKILKSVYQGNVHPHLEYGSSSWMTHRKTAVL